MGGLQPIFAPWRAGSNELSPISHSREASLAGRRYAWLADAGGRRGLTRPLCEPSPTVLSEVCGFFSCQPHFFLAFGVK